MHTQHLIGRVKMIQADLRNVSDDLQLRGHTVMAEELRREAKSMDGLLLTLRADLAEDRKQDEARRSLRDKCMEEWNKPGGLLQGPFA
jgi:septal ring factor EnvC (AmiA/AmiB activator)